MSPFHLYGTDLNEMLQHRFFRRGRIRNRFFERDARRLHHVQVDRASSSVGMNSVPRKGANGFFVRGMGRISRSIAAAAAIISLGAGAACARERPATFNRTETRNLIIAVNRNHGCSVAVAIDPRLDPGQPSSSSRLNTNSMVAGEGFEPSTSGL